VLAAIERGLQVDAGELGAARRALVAVRDAAPDQVPVRVAAAERLMGNLAGGVG
jgi:hypothetical protein